MDRQPRPRPEGPTTAGAAIGVGRPSRRPGAAVRGTAVDRPGRRRCDGPDPGGIPGRGAERIVMALGRGTRPHENGRGPDCLVAVVWPPIFRATPHSGREGAGPARRPKSRLSRLCRFRRLARLQGLSRPEGEPVACGAERAVMALGRAHDPRRRDAGNSCFPSSRSDLRGPGCVPERTGLGSGRIWTAGPIPARAPDETSGPCGAPTASGPIGIAPEDRPARGTSTHRGGLPVPEGAGGRISVAGRLPKRDEMEPHDLSQSLLKSRLADFEAGRRYEIGTKWTSGAKSTPRGRRVSSAPRRPTDPSAGDARGGGPCAVMRRDGPSPGCVRPRLWNGPRRGTERIGMAPGRGTRPDARSRYRGRSVGGCGAAGSGGSCGSWRSASRIPGKVRRNPGPGMGQMEIISSDRRGHAIWQFERIDRLISVWGGSPAPGGRHVLPLRGKESTRPGVRPKASAAGP
jgi:hypothetical protein